MEKEILKYLQDGISIYATGLLFFDKYEADNESGWCGLHFIVKTREVK
jgi:hypothetical protein